MQGAQRFFACSTVGGCTQVCFLTFRTEAFLQEGYTLPWWCWHCPTGNLFHGRGSRAASGILCPDCCGSKSVFSSFWVGFLLCSCSPSRSVCLELAGRGETHRLGGRQGARTAAGGRRASPGMESRLLPRSPPADPPA